MAQRKSVVSDLFYSAILVALLSVTGCGQEVDKAAPSGESGLNSAGMAAYWSKSYPQAIAYFNQQLEQFPTGVLAENGRFFRGRAYYWLKQYDSAISDFDQLLANSNSIRLDDIHYYHARSLYWLERYPEAINEFTVLLASPDFLVSTKLDVKLYRGRAYYWLADYVSAAIDFDELRVTTNLDDSRNGAVYWSGKIAHINNDYVGARDLYSQVTDTTSSWYDDAKLQIAKTYYDEAANLTDPSVQFEAYQQVITRFLSVVSIPNSSTASSANYYLGRCKNKQASLLLANPAIVSTDSVTGLYSAARLYYGLVPADSVFADDAGYYSIRSRQAQAPGIYAASFFDDLRADYTAFTIQYAQSSWADDARYQISKLYYEEANALIGNNFVTTALEKLDQAIAGFTELTQMVVVSNRADSASYFLGRAYHIQALYLLVDPSLRTNVSASDRFDSARAAYANVASFNVVSNWIDNAEYRVGASYYDQAKYFQLQAELAGSNLEGNQVIQSHYTRMQEFLNDAVNSFDRLVKNINYVDVSSVDDAQYYLGHSYLRVTEIPDRYRIDLSANAGINFTTIQLSDARIEFEKILNDSRFANSTWRDNAYYVIGDIYYLEAINSTSNRDALFNSALSSFQAVLVQFPGSIRTDNAAFGISRVYHETGRCNDELDWIIYTLSLLNVSASISAEAQLHQVDIETAISTSTATALHSCSAGSSPGVPVIIPPVDAGTIEQSSFQEGLGLFRSGDYSGAVARLITHLNDYPTGPFADDAKFYLGRAYFELLNYTQAIVFFNMVISDHADSNVLVDSQYWAGRSEHESGNFVSARTYYALVPSDQLLRDNADYQIGKSYYDQAGLATTNVEQLSLWDSAVNQFNVFLTNHVTSSLRDDGFYYLGRSLHHAANVVANDVILMLTRDPLLLFTDARIAYNKVPGISSRADNAVFQIGRSYYDEAGTHVALVDQYNVLGLAISQFTLFDQGQRLSASSEAYSALYFLGRSYHGQAALLGQQASIASITAQDTYQAARDSYAKARIVAPLGIYDDNIQYYLARSYYDSADLNAGLAQQFQAYETGYSIFTSFVTDPAYNLSVLAYSARYYVGRTRQQQALLLWQDPTLSPSLTASQSAVEAGQAFSDTILAGSIGAYYDNAFFYLARMDYDEAKYVLDNAQKVILYTQTIQKLAIFNSDPVLSVSDYRHNAYYYTGRSNHQLADLLLIDPTLSTTLTRADAISAAQTAYGAIASVGTVGIYVDNANYYLGRILFDDAAGLTSVALQYDAYQQATAYFTRFIPPNALTDSSLNHYARFFLGKCYTAQAGLVLLDPALSSSSWSSLRFQARTAYQLTVVADPVGIYADNAQYLLGRSFFDEGDATLDAASKYVAYNQARDALSSFLSGGDYPNSFYAPRALYYLAESTYGQGLLLQRNPGLAGGTGVTAISLFNDAISIYQDVINNDPAGTSADNAQYRIGKSFYELGQTLSLAADKMTAYNDAMNAFLPFLGGGALSGSTFMNDAEFFNARSRHEQAVLLLSNVGLSVQTADQVFVDARGLYDALIANDPLGVYADNAAVQIGVTHYNAAEYAQLQAELIVPTGDPTSQYSKMQMELNSAISQFKAVLTDANYVGSNSLDNAQFYVGRSYHRGALIPSNYKQDLSASLGAGNVDFTTVDFNTARQAYAILLSDNRFAGSTLFASAIYETGNTYFQEASWDNALTEYNKVLTIYPGTDNFDDAAFMVAMTYHSTEHCDLEKTWMNYVNTINNVDPDLLTQSNAHVADLNTVAPISHACAGVVGSVQVLSPP